jgi:hypothetical protein
MVWSGADGSGEGARVDIRTRAGLFECRHYARNMHWVLVAGSIYAAFMVVGLVLALIKGFADSARK